MNTSFQKYTKLMWVLSLAGLFRLNSEALANEIQSQTTTGTGSLTEYISYSGHSKNADDSYKNEAGWNWNLGYTYNTLTLGATAIATPTPPKGATAPSNVDHTSSFSGGFGYSDHWSAGIDINYSKTKEENLSSLGPSLHAGYTFDLKTRSIPVTSSARKITAENAESAEESEEPFIPTLNLTVTGATTNYSQTFLTVVRAGSKRTATTRTGSQGIVQRLSEIAATLSPVEWAEFSISTKIFSYDHNVANFIANLDDPRAVRSGAASFGSTLSGFSDRELDFDFTFHLPLALDLSTGYSQSSSASDSSKTNTFHTHFSRIWGENWNTGLGFERDKSPADAQNLVIFTLAYLF